MRPLQHVSVDDCLPFDGASKVDPAVQNRMQWPKYPKICFTVPTTDTKTERILAKFYLEYFGTNSGVHFEGLGVEAAPTALTLCQIPGTSSHPQAACIPTWSGRLVWTPNLICLTLYPNSLTSSAIYHHQQYVLINTLSLLTVPTSEKASTTGTALEAAE